MRVWLQAVGEEFDDAGAAEFSRRQADGVDDDEIDRTARGRSSQLGEGTLRTPSMTPLSEMRGLIGN